MTFGSVARHLKLLASGDSQAWRYLPYQIRTKFHRLDLGWASVGESGLSHERSHWHSNSGGPDLEKLLRTLVISPSDAILDIGCGKGGAMLTLVRYPFARVDGVEISPNLARIAQENLRRCRAANSKVFCCDAADFTDLDEYTHFYMYNPFPQVIMKTVMQNIALSLKRRPRTATLIYKNPVFGDVVLGAGFRKTAETRQIHQHYPPFSVYSAEAMASTPLEESVTHARV